MVDIFEIAKWLGAIGTILGVVGIFLKYMKKHEKEHEELREITTKNNDNLRVVMASMLGILDGMIEQGLNGPVKQAKKDLSEYLIDNRYKKEEK